MEEGINSVAKAVKLIGKQEEVGREFGVRQQTISQWIRLDRVPAAHVIKFEEVLKSKGSAIDRHDLCPDVFGERVVSNVAQSA